MNGYCCGCRTRIVEWMVTTAGAAFATTSAYDATGIIEGGLFGALLVEFGFVVDARWKSPRPRVQPPIRTTTDSRLINMPTRAGKNKNLFISITLPCTLLRTQMHISQLAIQLLDTPDEIENHGRAREVDAEIASQTLHAA